MRRLELFFISVVGSFSLIIGCSKETSVQPSTSAFIKGRITDLATGSAVADAYITTAPPSQSVGCSDGAGNYQIEITQVGLYVVSVSKVGFAAGHVSVLTTVGKSTVADVGLTAGNSDNNDPTVPANPQPANQASAQPTSIALGWSCTDPDGDELTYDVYFGLSNPPSELKGSNLSVPSLSLSGLDTGATYYWSVLARDTHGGMTSGPGLAVQDVGNSDKPYGTCSGVPAVRRLQWLGSEYTGSQLFAVQSQQRQFYCRGLGSPERIQQLELDRCESQIQQ